MRAINIVGAVLLAGAINAQAEGAAIHSTDAAGRGTRDAVSGVTAQPRLLLQQVAAHSAARWRVEQSRVDEMSRHCVPHGSVATEVLGRRMTKE